MRKRPYVKLPKKWRGVPVARGKGLHYKKYEKLVDENAFAWDEWPNGGVEFFVVLADRKDESEIRDGKVFGDRASAVMFAKAAGSGNCDQRVLRCTHELFVIATDNDI